MSQDFYHQVDLDKRYRKIPQQIQQATDKQLELLLSNPQHPYPELATHTDDTYILREIGTHDTLKKP